MTEYSRPNGLKCIRCDFNTDANAPFVEQDVALMVHLNEKHPKWRTDGRMAAIKEVATVSDTDKIAAKDEQVTRLKVLLREYRNSRMKHNGECTDWKLCDRCKRTDKELES